MTGVTHRLGGTLTGIILAEQICSNHIETGVVLTGAIIGSLLPDIDNVHSTIGSMFPEVARAVRAGQKIIRLISYLFPGKLGRNIRSLVGHRGILHSLLIPGMLMVAALMQGNALAALFLKAFSLGMISHLFLDVPAGGVPLLMPVSTKRMGGEYIHNGGLVEKIIALGIVGAGVMYIYQLQ